MNNHFKDLGDLSLFCVAESWLPFVGIPFGSAFVFVFAKCRGKQESPPSFIFSNEERTKAQQNSFSRCFSVREVDYRKGRC